MLSCQTTNSVNTNNKSDTANNTVTDYNPNDNKKKKQKKQLHKNCL